MKPKPYYKTEIPETSGCYIFRHYGLVLYVGQARNFKKRLQVSNHRAVYQIEVFYPRATVEFVECPIEKLNTLERALIANLKPLMNGSSLNYVNDVYFSPEGHYKRKLHEIIWRQVKNTFQRVSQYIETLKGNSGLVAELKECYPYPYSAKEFRATDRYFQRQATKNVTVQEIVDAVLGNEEISA